MRRGLNPCASGGKAALAARKKAANSGSQGQIAEGRCVTVVKSE
jgi:hypothetical protein